MADDKVTATRSAFVGKRGHIREGREYPASVADRWPGLFASDVDRIDEVGAGAPPARNGTNDEWRQWGPARAAIGDDIDGMTRKEIIAALEADGVLGSDDDA